MPLPEGVRAVLLDIEGATTPISFVYDVLFPFAAARLDEFCGKAAERPAVADAIATLRQEYEEESRGGAELPDFGNGAPFAQYLMRQDRKATGLKSLQGLIWEDGYDSGELRGQVFADVPDALKKWKAQGIRVRVFSSGSVLAQKLLFSHTEHGDLTPLFEGFHDTTTGPKREAASYMAIARAFDLPPEEILFLSDVVEELDAAQASGMVTGLMVRPGNKPVAPSGHTTYQTFEELLP